MTNTQDKYYQKYLKYKAKYFNLKDMIKQQQTGGSSTTNRKSLDDKLSGFGDNNNDIEGIREIDNIIKNVANVTPLVNAVIPTPNNTGATPTAIIKSIDDNNNNIQTQLDDIRKSITAIKSAFSNNNNNNKSGKSGEGTKSNLNKLKDVAESLNTRLNDVEEKLPEDKDRFGRRGFGSGYGSGFGSGFGSTFPVMAPLVSAAPRGLLMRGGDGCTPAVPAQQGGGLIDEATSSDNIELLGGAPQEASQDAPQEAPQGVGCGVKNSYRY